MKNYILSLIKENNRVIIPEFGAFIVAKENGISVLFNNFLSFNDGLLIDHLVKEENIGKDEAATKVSTYVTQLKESLDSAGSYTIEGLGKFTKDASGIVRFVQADELVDPKQSDASGLDVEDDLLDIDSDDSKEILADEEPVVGNQTASVTVIDTTPVAEVEDERPRPVVEPISKPAKEVEQKKDSVSPAADYIDEDNKKRKRSIIWLLILFILLPLLAYSVYYLVLKDDSPTMTENMPILKPEVKEEITDELPSEDVSAIDAGPVMTEKAPEEIKKPTPEPLADKPHYLIIGSFKNEANADKMIRRLNAKDYNQCSRFEHNNRYLVSLESFAKVSKARIRQEEILEKDHMESWIITIRK